MAPSAFGGPDVTPVRVVVLGDSGTGKSTLVKRLVAQLGGACAPSHGTTVGAHIEAVVWPASVMPDKVAAGQRPVVIELIEMGGNRGFTPAARLPFFAHCAAAILVYSEAQEESRKSLVAWYNELEAARAAASSSAATPGAVPPFIVVGTKAAPAAVGAVAGLRPTSATGGGGEEGMHHSTAEASFEALVVSKVPAASGAFAAVRQALAVVSGVALMVLSFVLLGRLVVPWAGVSASEAIAYIERRAGEAAAAAAGGTSSSHAASSSSLPIGRGGDDEGQSMLRRVGGGREAYGVAAAMGSSGPAPAHATGAGGSPFLGHVEGVSLASDREFAATGEGLFDFVSDVVRSTSPVSSRSSESGAAAASSGRGRYAP
mmetsp:Transcript_25187/g.77763  ORF Transcript_25187/g.77763 Transcript_25187/m.77763 type:complete len:374 (-) Transcript_25187:48-1169(-)